MTIGGHWTRSPRAAGRLAAIGAVSPLVWWLGWHPGFVDRDGLALLIQIDAGAVTTTEPIAYTGLVMLLQPLGGIATVTLLQAALLVAAAVWAAAALTRLGLPSYVTGIGTAAILFTPAVATSSISLWSDAMASPALVVLAVTSVRVGGSIEPPARRDVVRLGFAAAVLWAFRPAEVVTIALIGVALVARHRERVRLLAPAGMTIAATIAVFMAAGWLLPVDRTGGRATDVLTATLAAVHAHHPDSISATDRAFMEEVAPLDVWRHAYDCHDARSLLDDREFDLTRLRERPAAVRGAATRAAAGNVGTAIGHRLCAAEFVLLPPEPGGQVFRGPAYTIPFNDLGIEREPVVDRMFRITKSVWLKTIQPDRRWLWWRPGLPLLVSTAAFIWLAATRRRRWMWAWYVVASHALAVTAVIVAPEFREVFGLYVVGWLSVVIAAGAATGSRDVEGVRNEVAATQ